MSIQHLPYIDIQVSLELDRMRSDSRQHDALSVFDDVEQGVVAQEDIWVSAVSLMSARDC